MNALKIRGCHFHFAQPVWRHIQECIVYIKTVEDDPNFTI